MPNPLSKKQKAYIAQLARRAFSEISKCGLADGLGETDAERFKNWRRQEQEEACGKASLTRCNQDDYLGLKAHFEVIAGDLDKAFNTNLKNQPVNDHADEDDSEEKRAQIIARIEQELATQNCTLGYAAAIARNTHKLPKNKDLNTLTTKQLTQLLMSVKRAMKSKAEKTA